MTATVTTGPGVAAPHERRVLSPFAIQRGIDARRAIRLPPDPFWLWDTPLDGSRPSEESIAVARSIAIQIDGAPIDDHVGGLASAPVEDLRALRSEGGRILFAPTFVAAVDSIDANRLRGRPIHPATRAQYVEMDRFPHRYFGAYDRELHAMIFTGSDLPLNYERISLHELGHARTLRPAYRRAALRADLLQGLPREIETLLEAYGNGADRELIRELVLEVLAEGYVWIQLGRGAELPLQLVDAVWGLLNGGDLAGPR
jgi:hypothetical protein